MSDQPGDVFDEVDAPAGALNPWRVLSMSVELPVANDWP
jgi:hypothetical protein